MKVRCHYYKTYADITICKGYVKCICGLLALSLMTFLILVKANIICNIPQYSPLKETMISILGEREAMKELGRRLKLHRLRQNLPQQYVADLVGISMPTYRKIEAGVGSVEFRHVARALGVLGFSEALHNLIPEPETNLKLNDLLATERLKASPRTSK
jgi:DNA-binding XRE family transcriptional regulator